MTLKIIRPLLLLLILGTLTTAALAQTSVVFGDKDHLNNWIAQGNHFIPFNLDGNPNNAVVVCFKDSGDVYLVSFPNGTGKDAAPALRKVGTSYQCKTSFDFLSLPLPTINFIQRLRDIQRLLDQGGFVTTGSSAEPVQERAADADLSTSVLPLFRSIPLPPGYPATALSGIDTGCNPANNVGFLMVEHLNGTLAAGRACAGTRIGNGVPVISNPLQVAITPDQNTALVTSFDGAVNFINLNSVKSPATLSTPGDNPSGIAISSDGSTAYVTSFTNSGALLTIDIASRKITNRLPLAFFPQSVVLSPDDSQAWVIFPFADAIVIVDTLTATVSRTLQITSPFGVAFNSTGTRAYVSSRQQNVMQVFDTATLAVIKSVAVGRGPVEIRIAPDDAFGVVSNFDGSSMTVFDPDSLSTSTFSLPGQPFGIALVQ